MVKSYNKLVKLYNEEKADTVLNSILKVIKHMVKALSFTVGISIAISMMFLTVFGLNTTPYRGQKQGIHRIWFGFLDLIVEWSVKTSHIVGLCDATNFRAPKFNK